MRRASPPGRAAPLPPLAAECGAAWRPRLPPFPPLIPLPCTSYTHTPFPSLSTTPPPPPTHKKQGGGLTHIIMPLFFDALVKLGHPKFTAWRLAFYMPAAMHVLSGILIFLFGQDTPAGRTAAVRKAAGLKNDMSWPSWRAAVLNYRTWALTAVYAVTFGTGELIGMDGGGRENGEGAGRWAWSGEQAGGARTC